MAMLLITHDMGVIAGHADRVNVMYAGRVVETAEAVELFDRDASSVHPGTARVDSPAHQDSGRALHAIPGLPPDLASLPPGCRFAPRCPRATDKCRTDEPPLRADRSTVTCSPAGIRWTGPDASADGPAGPDALSTGLIGPAAELEAAELGAPGLEAAALDGADGGAPEVAAGTETVDASRAAPVGFTSPNGRRGAGRQGGQLLELRNLVKEFPVTSGAILQRRVGAVHAVSDVSFSVPAGTTFGLVGESGCGKTTIGKLIVALEAPDSGTVTLGDVDMTKLRGAELRRRRRDLQLMFQDPHASLDPRMRVGAIIGEPLAIQHVGSRRQQRDRVFELLGEVGLPRNAVERYPHEFSGGQRQRIGLARALTLNPRLIVADEPVSALDVSIRAQVLNLMKRLQATHGLTYVVISHDLAVVKYMADRIGVMYLGKLVESGSAGDIYQRAAHPYTAGLIAAIPTPEPSVERAKVGAAIKGELPSPVNPPSGCRFRTRCPFAQELCSVEEPELRSFGPGHVAACHFPLQAPATEQSEAALTAAPDSAAAPGHVACLRPSRPLPPGTKPPRSGRHRWPGRPRSRAGGCPPSSPAGRWPTTASRPGE